MKIAVELDAEAVRRRLNEVLAGWIQDEFTVVRIEEVTMHPSVGVEIVARVTTDHWLMRALAWLGLVAREGLVTLGVRADVLPGGTFEFALEVRGVKVSWLCLIDAAVQVYVAKKVKEHAETARLMPLTLSLPLASAAEGVNGLPDLRATATGESLAVGAGCVGGVIALTFEAVHRESAHERV